MRWLLLLLPTGLSALCPFTLLLGAALLGGAAFDGSFDIGAEALYGGDFGMRIRSSYGPLSMSGTAYHKYMALESRTNLRWLYLGGRYASLAGRRGMGPTIGVTTTHSVWKGELGASALFGKKILPGIDGRLSLHTGLPWRSMHICGEIGVAVEQAWHRRLGFAGPFAALEIGF